ncbi:hypothetical protein SAMN05444359_1315 [Neolewinella agarilytica]|uniref:Uncharacterized protein n=1 Tax=Neolewinella agarilytica TaxID=478744 RepID=A0A1H9MQX8_9BACT|nr:hypothetical protein SAMN05444359_1315 [Neolewinella agarilytica]
MRVGGFSGFKNTLDGVITMALPINSLKISNDSFCDEILKYILAIHFALELNSFVST